MSLNTWCRQSPSRYTTFTLNSHWGRVATGRKKKKSCTYARWVSLVLSDSLRPCRLWPARLPCQGGLFSRQEYWSVLANTGCHTLLEHFISCCPTANPPEYLVLSEPLRPTTSTPGPRRGKPKPSSAASGAKPHRTTHM